MLLTSHHFHSACSWDLIMETYSRGKIYSIKWRAKEFLLCLLPPFPVHMYVCMHESETRGAGVCVSLCVCVQDTEMLMCLLWALSSTLSISVYNAKWEKVPVISWFLKAGESRRKRQEPGGHCFVLKRPAGLFVRTLLKDMLTSWWSHSVWFHEFRLIHAATEVPLSEQLTGSVVTLRQILFIMLGVCIYGKEPAHC